MFNEITHINTHESEQRMANGRKRTANGERKKRTTAKLPKRIANSEHNKSEHKENECEPMMLFLSGYCTTNEICTQNLDS